jgi:hypothetical protein
MPYGSASISVNIDDPVVVNPEQLSKNASTKDGIELLKIKGRVPKKITKNHERVTVRNPSLFVIFKIGTSLEII